MAMLAVATIFALLAILLLVVPIEAKANPPVPGIAIRIPAAIFLTLLATVSFLFGIRLTTGRKNADGFYLPPWGIGFVGIVLGVTAIGQALFNNDWKLLAPAISVMFLMLGVPFAAFQNRRIARKLDEAAARAPMHKSVPESVHRVSNTHSSNSSSP
jgi:uncharacterized membrane protein